MSRLRRWTPALAWAAVILVLTSIPNPRAPHIAGLDKVVHFGIYGVLGYLAARVAPGAGLPTRLTTIVAISLFAAADEWHQQFIPGRSQEAADWAADTAGACAATLFAAASRRRRDQPS